jgi:hypothetical protein
MTLPSEQWQAEHDKLLGRLSALEARERVAAIAAHVLASRDARSRDQRITGAEIFSEASRLGLDPGVEKGTFQAYLSLTSGSASSAIASTGRGRGGGYYLSAAAARVAADVEETTPVENEPSEGLGEECLYPVLQQWLAGVGYQTRITASMRALGKWGNPDVTGIRVTEHLGRLDVELLPLEAKLTLSSWEYWFFEAVAHRRFANRAYFAFPLPEDAAAKLPDDLRYCCELYRVGVVVMVLDNELYERIMAKGQTTPLSFEDVTINEVYTAPYNSVPLTYQRRFCEAVEIRDIGRLFTWGAAPRAG